MEFFRHQFASPVPAKEFKVQDYLSDYHAQDCCENVYVDFEDLEIYRDQIDELGFITEFLLSGVKNEWIVMFLYNGTTGITGEPHRLWIFMACRNSQNGYYSDNLELIVKVSESTSHRFDLREMEFIKDEID